MRENYDAANYRPVSLILHGTKPMSISSINKLIVSMVSEVRGETQLVQLSHYMVSSLDQALNRGQKQTGVIIMDFTNAFNKVPHGRLL